MKSTAILPATGFQGPAADNRVLFFGDAYLGATGSVPLPQFTSAGKNFTGHGLFAFWNSAATALYVLERADSAANLLSTDSIYTISTSSGCAAAPLGAISTLPAAGGYGSTAIAAATGCAWSAVSDSSWLTVTAGAIGAGPANISFSATANTGTANRTANISIGGQSWPVTQLGTSATPLVLSPSTLSFSTVWSSTTSVPAQTLSVKTGSGPFGVTANSSWITVAPAGSIPGRSE